VPSAGLAARVTETFKLQAASAAARAARDFVQQAMDFIGLSFCLGCDVLKN
jgi:hypothetical protein